MQITGEYRVKTQLNGTQHFYTYYHCTKKSKTQKCPEPCIRQESLDAQISSLLQKVSMPQDWADYLNMRLEKDKTEYQPATLQVPDNNHDVDNSICGALLACEDCGRNYKIIEQELKFYKNQGVPIPKKCFYCRHKNRFNLRNLRVLYGRKCDLCGVDIQTTYPVSRPEKIYCEKCYQESLT